MYLTNREAELMLVQCRYNVYDVSPTLPSHCAEVSCYLGRPTHPIPVQCWTRIAAYCWFNVGVPRMQQWPLAFPQWHITPHPQLSAKIIILYAFHTHRRIKSKFPNHINSIYLSDIYEEIIHQVSHVGFVLRHKRLCYHGRSTAYWQWELTQPTRYTYQMLF